MLHFTFYSQLANFSIHNWQHMPNSVLFLLLKQVSSHFLVVDQTVQIPVKFWALLHVPRHKVLSTNGLGKCLHFRAHLHC